jgi:hypothetical protein
MQKKNVHYAQDMIQEIPMYSGQSIFIEDAESVNNSLRVLDTDDTTDNNTIDKRQLDDEKTDTSSSCQNEIIHKMNLMKFSNGWNDKNEQIIISIGENAASYKWMHENSANECKFIYSCISIISIILTTGLSAEITLFSGNSDYTITILKQMIIYIVNVLTIVQNFLRYQELYQKHLFAAGDFSELYHDIQQQMCMYRRERVPGTMYVSECLKKYDSFIVRNPEIGSRILARFKRTFKEVDMITDKIQKIEIITEPKTKHRRKKSINIAQHVQDTQSTNTATSIVTVQLVKRNSNLSEIHSAFQIQGDITDAELQTINPNELIQLKEMFLDKKLDYEYQRFRQHTREND